MRHHHYRQARGDPRHRRMPQAFAALVIACALGTLLPASALAESSPDAAPPTNPVVASYASDYSVTLVEAQRRLERIPALQDIIGTLHNLEAGRLAGWGINHHGPMIAWVWLTGTEPPSSAAAEIADAHSDAQITTGATVTFAALTAAQDKFGIGAGIGAVGNTGAADTTQIDWDDLMTHTAVDLRANALEIGIDTSRAQASPSSALESLGPLGPVGTTGATPSESDTLAKITALLAPHIAVPYKVIDAEPIEDNVAFEGGHRMTNGSAVCTSGFTASRNSTGKYGIITAGHCDHITWTTQGVTVTRKVKKHNASVDAAFYLIPEGQGHTVTNKIVCSNHPENPRTCAINSIGPSRLLMLGDHVCHAGTNSGVSCGTVDNIRYQPNPDDGCDGNGATCQAVFVRASGPNLRSCKGDSGGPVYSYSAAYGIHKAGPKSNPCDKTNSFIVFSSIRRVQNALGVAVVTNWPSSVP